MIKIEGYKAFRGILKITPFKGKPYCKTGDFLYKPDTRCWYDGWSSYPAEICEVEEEFNHDVQV